MSEYTIAQAAKQATVFLEEFYNDILLMIETLDGKFATRGWYPKEKNKVSFDLGNALSSKHWVLKHILRLYVERRDEPCDRAIAFGIHFADDGFDRAVCFMASGFFCPANSSAAIWEEWNDSSPLLEVLSRVGLGKHVEVEGDALAELFPSASKAKAFAVSLDEFVDGSKLDSLLIEPAIAASLEIVNSA